MLALGVLLAQDLFRDGIIRSLASETNLAVCEEDPSAWGSQAGRFSIFAYDSLGHSVHPQAPPLEAAQLQQAVRTGRPSRTFAPDGKVTTVVSVGETGPCAVVRITGDPPGSGALQEAAGVLGMTAVGGMILAAAAAWLFVVFPLQRRIHALSEAASEVGSE